MKSEALVQSEIRAEAGRLGIHLWRNNVGAMQDDTGRIVRYGLANETPQMGKRLKSSDLIGIVNKMSHPIHSNNPVGVFLAVECKHEGWTFEKTTGAERDRAIGQLRFMRLVKSQGGLAGFATSVADFRRIIAGTYKLPELPE